jgi:hypothetical protein
MIDLTIRCPSCDRPLQVRGAATPDIIKCGGCFREIPLDWSDAVREDRTIDACPLCQGRDFYTRKDFDPKVGLGLVIAGALVSAVFYWYGLDLIAYGILAAAVLIDLLVARRLTDVTVCYRCHGQFRGSYQRTAPAFDLHTADVLEPEYERRIGRR